MFAVARCLGGWVCVCLCLFSLSITTAVLSICKEYLLRLSRIFEHLKRHLLKQPLSPFANFVYRIFLLLLFPLVWQFAQVLNGIKNVYLILMLFFGERHWVRFTWSFLVVVVGVENWLFASWIWFVWFLLSDITNTFTFQPKKKEKNSKNCLMQNSSI